MLRFLFYIAATCAIIVGLAFGYGTTLPREHVATSRIVLAQPLDQVWEVVRNPAALKGTWTDLTRAERVVDPSGREVWDETVDGFDMRIVITEARPPIRLVTTIDAPPSAAFGGRWIYQLEPAPSGGTQVTITEEGWVKSPLYRVMGRMFGQHQSIDGYLKALGQHFTEAPRVDHLDR